MAVMPVKLCPLWWVTWWLSFTPALTAQICDPESRGLEGKIISVEGKIVFTMHGIVLIPLACDGSAPGLAVLMPGSAVSPHVEFELDADVPRQLAPFVRPSGGVAVACGILRGQLFRKRGFRLRQFGGGPQGNGYGYRGVHESALVIREIVDIGSCG